MTAGTSLEPISFPALGTTATVVVDGGRQASKRAVDAVKEQLDAIDRACSRFRPDSELARLNEAAGRPLAASALFLDAVSVALRAARLTGGLVDPTIGRAMREIGYDRDFDALTPAPEVSVPAPRPVLLSPASCIATGKAAHPAGATRPHAGPGPVLTLLIGGGADWHSVVVDRQRATVCIPDGVELDLGATAKALASDRAAGAAYRAARCGVLVSLGGDIAVAGVPPRGGWSIRVADDHAATDDDPGETVSVTSGALATSGTTVRRWRHGDAVVHHLVDPGTGRPAETVWRTVSVAAATCVDANTASTAAIILGRGAPDWLAGHGLPARLVSPDGFVTVVAGWPRAS
ncbi:MAG: FAD:protein FMN transferase [Acidimicrobiales bacterium]